MKLLRPWMTKRKIKIRVTLIKDRNAGLWGGAFLGMHILKVKDTILVSDNVKEIFSYYELINTVL